MAVVQSQFREGKPIIEGYTHANKAFNLELSRERAQAVKDWVVRNRNVLAAHTFTKGVGEEFAIAPNIKINGTRNPLGRALNRRVSIIVEKPAATPMPTPAH